MPEPEENKVTLDGDLSHLKSVAIQIHELYSELKGSGFSEDDALHLAGMVLSSGVIFKRQFNYAEMDDQGEDLDFGDDDWDDDDF